MSNRQSNPWTVALLTTLAAVAVPPVVFLITGLAEGMSAAAAMSALVAQYGATRPNLLVTGGVGLIPLALLGIVLWIHRARGGDPRRRRYLFWYGLIPVLAVLAWSNHSFWSVFLPNLTPPGFPHGLELVIGPLLFAPVALAAGLLSGWLLGRRTT